MIRGRCPTCSKEFAIEALDDLPSFPFCSDRCRLVDLGRWIDGRVRLAVNVEMVYRLRVICDQKHEGIIRTILLRHVNTHPGMTIQGIAMQDDDHPDKTAVVADIFSLRRDDRAMEDLMSRLNIEPTVTAVRWEHVS